MGFFFFVCFRFDVKLLLVCCAYMTQSILVSYADVLPDLRSFLCYKTLSVTDFCCEIALTLHLLRCVELFLLCFNNPFIAIQQSELHCKF